MAARAMKSWIALISTILSWSVCECIGVARGKSERWHAERCPRRQFAGVPGSLPARDASGQQTYQRLHHRGGGVDNVFAIVDHEKKVASANRARHCLRRGFLLSHTEAQTNRDSGGNKIGI